MERPPVDGGENDSQASSNLDRNFSYARRLKETVKGGFDSLLRHKLDLAKNGFRLGAIGSLMFAIDSMIQGGPQWYEWYRVGAISVIPGFSLIGASSNLERPISFKGDNRISHALSIAEGSTSLLAAVVMNAATFGEVKPEMFLGGLTLAGVSFVVTGAHSVAERIMNPRISSIST